MSDLLPLPTPRLTDWLGVWAIEQLAAQTLLEAVRGLDWQTHLASYEASPKPVVASAYSTVEAKGRRLAVIPIAGTMMKSRSSMGGTSTVETRRQIRAAVKDPEVSGVLLRIDSPGGTVAGTYDLAGEVANARRQKPVVAQIEDVGASAAYWVASQASRVYASTPTAMVGSIGTLLVVSKGPREGLAVFRSGPHKGVGVDGEITEDQAAHLQSLVNGWQAEFDSAVSSGRRLTPEQIAEVSTGATWLAGRAQQLRLLDGVQSIEQTIDLLATMR